MAAWVRAMFERLAPRYDLFNEVLSAGIHRRWRRHAIAALAPRHDGLYLDLCAGTFDLARRVAERSPGARVVGVDFALAMLARGRAKLGAAGNGASGREGGHPRHDGGEPGPPAVWAVAGDALALPFPEATFAGCIIGFGLRNLADPMRGLVEMRRVLAPRGRLVVLEFTTPPDPAFRAVYHAYFHHVLPRLGALVSGQREGPLYLPASVARFPDAPDLAALMAEAGFDRVRWRLLTGGIAAVHVGVRDPYGVDGGAGPEDAGPAGSRA
jgi:demethylmenaquinone methyltransferase/2-methoxy-6-polyprenyl-1,4-benzoquinol methylase